MPARIVLIVLLAPALCLPAGPVDPAKAGVDPARLAKIPERMKAFVERGEVAGAVTLVARKGALVLHEAAGFQDLEAKTPMRPDSIFQVMSMTKPVTAVAIALLMEEGRLALSDPVEKHLPEFRGQAMIAARPDDGRRVLRKPVRPITIRDLLTHTSGMSSMPPPGLAELYTKMNRTLAEAVSVFAQQPLEFEPGSRWLYSNPGIATLGRIVEAASGQPFEGFLETRSFKTLGMKDSFIFPPEAKRKRIAAVYRMDAGKLRKAGAETLGGEALAWRQGAQYSAPEFGLYSTAADLAALYQMMLDGGVFQGRRLLSQASVGTLTALHTGELQAGHLPGTGFGLAWEVVKEPLGTLTLMSPGSFGHGGAFGTHGSIDRRKQLVGVLLVQRTGGAADVRNAFMALAAASVAD